MPNRTIRNVPTAPLTTSAIKTLNIKTKSVVKTGNRKVAKRNKNLPVVLPTNAVVQIDTMMIEVGHTFVAFPAVFGLGGNDTFADIAELILDDVLVLLPVEDGG
jgi:hypothetical protein